MPELEYYSIFKDDEDVGAEADMHNLDTTIQVSPIPTTRIHKDLHLSSDWRFQSATQTRKMSKNLEEHRRIQKVYKVEKALYGLHQAPRAWYETLSTYLLDNEFQRGKITRPIHKRYKGDILLVQVYVDDIIFSSTKKEMCNAFEKLMHEKLQMSSMGELTFSWDYKSQDCKHINRTQKPLLKDEDGEEVDVHMYRSMIGSLMYLTSSRPDLCLPKLGLWYPKDSPFDLVAYTDSDYDGASLDTKSTTRGCKFLGCRLISWQGKKQTVVANSIIEAEYAKTINGEEHLHALVDGKKIIITESSVRRDLQLPDEEGIDCLPNSTIFEQPALMSPKTTTWNEFSSTM
ncbi:uncharacterized mitochondrial protein-like protein [Tanacetum coccineum]